MLRTGRSRAFLPHQAARAGLEVGAPTPSVPASLEGRVSYAYGTHCGDFQYGCADLAPEGVSPCIATVPQVFRGPGSSRPELWIPRVDGGIAGAHSPRAQGARSGTRSLMEAPSLTSSCPRSDGVRPDGCAP